jgi:hypothetical protein
MIHIRNGGPGRLWLTGSKEPLEPLEERVLKGVDVVEICRTDGECNIQVVDIGYAQ